MMCDATLGSIGGPVIVPKKLGKYLEELSSFPPQKKIGETVVYHIWRYPKIFPDFIVCVYFNVVHVKKRHTDTGETNGFLSLSNVHHTVSSQQASQCWLWDLTFFHTDTTV